MDDANALTFCSQSIHRQLEREHRTFTRFAFSPDPTVMKIDNALGNRQTDAGSGRATMGRIFDLMKRLEYFVQIFFFDSDAVVLYLYQQMIVCASQPDGNQPMVRVTKFYGIGQEVEHDLNQPVAVTGNNRYSLGEIQVNGYVFVMNQLPGTDNGIIDDLFKI